jgi:hypothetical protein
LHIRPLPSLRTIERVLQRNGVSVPKVRLAPFLVQFQETYLGSVGATPRGRLAATTPATTVTIQPSRLGMH